MNLMTTNNPDFTAHVDAITSIVGYVTELKTYRSERNRPNNKLYYPLKLAEEAGEVAEVAVALEGSRRKLKKLGGRVGARMALVEELGDVLNIVFLIAEQQGIEVSDVVSAAENKLRRKRNR